MIFVKMRADAISKKDFQDMLTELTSKYTQHIYEGYQTAQVVLSRDGQPFEIPNDVIRYADNEIIIYSFERCVDDDFYMIGLRGRTSAGLEKTSSIIVELRKHPAYDGRDLSIKLIGQKSDEPACIPCTKKKIERLRGAKR